MSSRLCQDADKVLDIDVQESGLVLIVERLERISPVLLVPPKREAMLRRLEVEIINGFLDSILAIGAVYVAFVIGSSLDKFLQFGVASNRPFVVKLCHMFGSPSCVRSISIDCRSIQA